MKKRALVLGSSLLGFALLAGQAAVAAEAEDGATPTRGFYAGGSIGGAIWDVGNNSDAFDPGFSPTDISDGGDLLWSVFGGYQINDWLGAEFGYTSLGGFDADDTSSSPQRYSEIDIHGVEARLRATYSVFAPEFALLGGVGIFVYDNDESSSCRNGATPVACAANSSTLAKKEDSGEALTLAAGAQYRVHDNVLLRAEYQHFFGVLSDDINAVMATVVVGFYDFFGQAGGGGDSFGGIVVE